LQSSSRQFPTAVKFISSNKTNMTRQKLITTTKVLRGLFTVSSTGKYLIEC
jgi:hypothetical protein